MNISKAAQITGKMEEISRLSFELLEKRKKEGGRVIEFQIRSAGAVFALPKEEACSFTAEACDNIKRVVKSRIDCLMGVITQNLKLINECVEEDISSYVLENSLQMVRIKDMSGSPIILNEVAQVSPSPAWVMRFGGSESEQAKEALDALNDCLEPMKSDMLRTLALECLEYCK
jgi:hypothetical protein